MHNTTRDIYEAIHANFETTNNDPYDCDELQEIFAFSVAQRVIAEVTKCEIFAKDAVEARSWFVIEVSCYDHPFMTIDELQNTKCDSCHTYVAETMHEIIDFFANLMKSIDY